VAALPIFLRSDAAAGGGAKLTRPPFDENAQLEHGSRVAPTTANRHAARGRMPINCTICASIAPFEMLQQNPQICLRAV